MRIHQNITHRDQTGAFIVCLLMSSIINYTHTAGSSLSGLFTSTLTHQPAFQGGLSWHRLSLTNSMETRLFNALQGKSIPWSQGWVAYKQQLNLTSYSNRKANCRPLSHKHFCFLKQQFLSKKSCDQFQRHFLTQMMVIYNMIIMTLCDAIKL